MQLPTFLGNHDMGRIGNFIQVANPDIERRTNCWPGSSWPMR